MNQQQAQRDLEDVLDDYAASEPGPSHTMLSEWIRRYPQYERELTEFTVSWGVLKWLPPSRERAEPDEELLVRRGMSVVQNLLHGQESIQPPMKEAIAAVSPEAAAPTVRAVAPAQFPDGLTAREVAVLQLIAAGKTNREIATALVISHETVARHVNTLLVKIGARYRVDVVAYAYRHHLMAPTDSCRS